MIEIIEKQYTIDTADTTEQYEAIKADITSWYDWTEIDDTTTDGTTVFKKYLPESESDYVGLKLEKSTNQYGVRLSVLMIKNGVTFTGISHGAGSGLTLRYVAVAKTEYGLFFIASDSALPFTPSTSTGATTFGVCSSKNAVTGESGICIFESKLQTTKGTYSFGKSTIQNYGDAQTLYNVVSNTEMIVVSPYTSLYSADVPDNILRLVYVPSGYTVCNNLIEFNGKKYRRLADILIPE